MVYHSLPYYQINKMKGYCLTCKQEVPINIRKVKYKGKYLKVYCTCKSCNSKVVRIIYIE